MAQSKRSSQRTTAPLRFIGEALAAEGVDWDEELEFVTRSLGKMIASRKSVFFHALTHSIRHYAQLTTLLRPHGVTMQFPLDYLFVTARRV